MLKNTYVDKESQLDRHDTLIVQTSSSSLINHQLHPNKHTGPRSNYRYELNFFIYISSPISNAGGNTAL
jgi:hypothetical protein